MAASQTPALSGEALLRVRGLNAYYGRIQALFDIDFDIAPGCVTTLLGANGAGKTTTLRALCGMIPTKGDIELDGTPIAGKATEDIVSLGVAHVPEGRGTFIGVTVEENLKLGAMTRRGPARNFRRYRADVPAVSPGSRNGAINRPRP